MMNRMQTLLLLSLLGLLTACKWRDNPPLEGAIYCVEGYNQSLNPQVSHPGLVVSSISAQLYNRLLRLNPVTQRLEGDLADSWQVSRDGLTYRFHLRANVPFQTTPWFAPNRLFNADDVLFSFERIINPKHPFHGVSGGRYPFFDAQEMSKLIRRVNRLSDQEVSFELWQPDAGFLASLASDYAVILSAEYGDQLIARRARAQMDTLPVGTGPFALLAYQPDEYLKLVRHPSYWEGEPPLERVVFDFSPSASRRVAKLLTGECQVAAFPAASQIDFIAQQTPLKLDIQTNLNTSFLAINTDKAPFNQLKVRQALAMAINRRKLLDAIFYDSADEADSLLPPSSWAHNPNLTPHPFDPAQARRLLAEAGYPDGFNMSLWVPPISRAYNPDPLKTAQLIQSDLKDVGIRLRIVQLKPYQMQRRLVRRQQDAVLQSWVANTMDPDNFYRPLLSCQAKQSNANNFSSWCNPHFDLLLDKAIATNRLADRITDYHLAETLIKQDVPLIPLAHALTIHAFRPQLRQLQVDPMGGVAFKQAYLKD